MRCLAKLLYVIAYDIPDDKRRLRVSDELEKWGDRVQFSVFECDLTSRKADELVDTLRTIVEPDDALRIYQLCEACIKRCKVIGGKELSRDAGFYQV